MDVDRTERDGHRWRLIVGWTAFAAIAALLLVSEHRLHALGALPYLLLLACPLMHVFMHHGHRHGSHEDVHGAPEPAAGGDRFGADRTLGA